ncbi:rod shape-determining protein MreC [Maribacter sp. TH_r10]|uniref:rod shape-determining protein MreC n=1 Tax=Maribacter sp. TH_r10 TaxID=3082086 RepID=UPI0029545E0C|nr:rod shape-determining protein MreC [Maribacter sp. TH_r10]MDV7138137.1 rod shape-determining protein MreC [Maribacter sp. TH_r10]
MQQIINFIIRYKNFLLYILLMIIAFAFTVQSHSYHQSRFFNSSNWLTGGIYGTFYGINTYFDLDDENERLLKENQRLRSQLFNQDTSPNIKLDSTNLKYTIVTGQVIKNSYAENRNYITINRGEKDSVKQDMGVITDLGILGIVENTSHNFATIQSILNTKSNINAKLKNTDHFGSLIWDAKTYNVVQLIDIPRLVPLHIGDTIVTGAMSSIFPENIPIGTIKKYDLDTSKSFYRIDVSLFNDMTNIKNVYIINNLNRKEILELEETTENE